MKVSCTVEGRLIKVSGLMIRRLISLAERDMSDFDEKPEETAKIELARELLDEMEVEYDLPD